MNFTFVLVLVVKMLIEDYEMDINDTGPGRTPLAAAKKNGHSAIIRFLESHDATE